VKGWAVTACFAAFVSIGGAESPAAVPRGALEPLPGAQGCVAVGGPATCAKGRALTGLSDIALSGDGRNLYATTREGVAIFGRARSTGALKQLRGRRGCATATGGKCATIRAIRVARALAVSDDGRNVYVTGFDSDAVGGSVGVVAVFARDRKTGSLTQLPGAAGCVRSDGADGCATARAGGGLSIALSQDDGSVYVGGSEGLGVLRRDRVSGALSELAGEQGCVRRSDAPAAGCMTGRGLKVSGWSHVHSSGQGRFSQVTAIAVSPDGRSVYTVANADEGEASLAVFGRDETTGALSQSSDATACIGAEEGCAHDLRGPFFEPSDVLVTPDGRSVYVASAGGGTGADDIGGGLTILRRNPGTGALTQPRGRGGCLQFGGGGGGCASTSTLQRNSDLAVSPDNRSVYVADSTGPDIRPSQSDARVGVLARAPRTAALTQLPGRFGCVGRSSICTRAPATRATRVVWVSRDGRNVYAGSSSFSDPFGALSSFRRTR